MTSSNRDYPSKVLLFGEYSVLVGSTALAHPLTKFSGYPVSLRSKINHFDLQGLYSYLKAFFSGSKDQYLNLKKLSNALKENWCFDSNIPVGKGLGSSGALCAAIFNEFKAYEIEDEAVLRKKLGEIESYFHVSSSGIDPLISLNKKSYLIDGEKNLKEVSSVTQSYSTLDDAGISVYLIDSGVSRQASPFVKLFQNKLEDQEFKNYLQNEYLSVNESCMNTFLDKNAADFKKSITKLSQLQLKIFKEMFLKDIYEYSKIVHNQNIGRLKLCGAGGGGFYMVFSFIGDDIKKYFPNYNVLKLKDYL